MLEAVGRVWKVGIVLPPLTPAQVAAAQAWLNGAEPKFRLAMDLQIPRALAATPISAQVATATEIPHPAVSSDLPSGQSEATASRPSCPAATPEGPQS